MYRHREPSQWGIPAMVLWMRCEITDVGAPETRPSFNPMFHPLKPFSGQRLPALSLLPPPAPSADALPPGRAATKLNGLRRSC